MIKNQKILVISERTPDYDNGSGDQKILFTTYHGLPNIYHFIIKNEINDNSVNTNKPKLRDKSKNIIIEKKKWRYSDFFRHFSFNHERYIKSDQLISNIYQEINTIICEKNIQLIVFEQTGILMWSWRKLFPDNIKCVLRIHDSHFHYHLLDAKTRRNIFSKIALIGVALTQKYYEKKFFPKWDQIQFLSEFEYKEYRSNFLEYSNRIVFTPPSIIIEKNKYLEDKEKNIDVIFVGTMTWKPNTDAVNWFYKNIFPIIKLRKPEIKIKIIGKNAQSKLNILEKNIEIIDFVPNLDNEYHSAKVFINPSISGGGIKVKLMEAAAFGFPIISTSQGISGFNNSIKENLIVADKPSEFANSIGKLIDQIDLREEFSRKIFDYAQKKFNCVENQKKWKEDMEILL